jgi:hypothetical protein
MLRKRDNVSDAVLTEAARKLAPVAEIDQLVRCRCCRMLRFSGVKRTHGPLRKSAFAVLLGVKRTWPIAAVLLTQSEHQATLAPTPKVCRVISLL